MGPYYQAESEAARPDEFVGSAATGEGEVLDADVTPWPAPTTPVQTPVQTPRSFAPMDTTTNADTPPEAEPNLAQSSVRGSVAEELRTPYVEECDSDGDTEDEKLEAEPVVRTEEEEERLRQAFADYDEYIKTGNEEILERARKYVTPDVVPEPSRLPIGAKRRAQPVEPARRPQGTASSSTAPPVARYAPDYTRNTAWVQGLKFGKRSRAKSKTRK